MPRSLCNTLTLFLAFVGCAVALLLTVEHYKHIDIGCSKTGQGCAKTLNSEYGHVGPVPTALFGLGMYGAIAGLCVARGRQLREARTREAERAAAYAVAGANDADAANLRDIFDADPASPALQVAVPSLPVSTSGTVRRLDQYIWIIAALGFGISMWLQYVAIYQLQSFCKYCFSSAILITLIIALASRDYILDGRHLTGEQKMIGFVLAFIGVLGLFIIGPDIWDVSQRNPPPPPLPPPHAVNLSRDMIAPAGIHTKGSATAKHILVEFADYQCGHCAEAAPAMETALHAYPSQIQIAFRNCPLPNHRWAKAAAAAAEAAFKQGKFWEMHDHLFQHTKEMEGPDFEDANFDKYAKEVGLDVKKFNTDRNSAEIKAKVQADITAADAARVDTTPTFFFVTPTKIVQFVGMEQMKKIMSSPKGDDWK